MKCAKINPDVVTLGQAFRQNGYFSARAGKIYHYGNPSMIGTDGHDDPKTWDEKYNPIGMDRTQQEYITRYGRGRQKDNNLGISMAWWDPVSKDTDHTDGKVASKIIDLIEQKKNEPFFLAAGFSTRTVPMSPLRNISISIRSIKSPCRTWRKPSVTSRMFLRLP